MKHSLSNGRKGLPLQQLCLILLGSSLWPEMEILVPSLPEMKTYFMVSEGQIQQLLSSNFLGFILGVIFAGPLCDAMGRKRVSLLGALLYLVFSVLACLSTTFSGLLTLRFLQGIAITMPTIGGTTMLMECTTGKKQVFWLSLSSASITFAMALAPIIGAHINQVFGFKGNLWAIFVMGLLGIIPFALFTKETLAQKDKSPLKVKSILKSYSTICTQKEFMLAALVVCSLPAAYWIYTGVSSLYLVNHLKLNPALFGRFQAPVVGTFAILSVSISHIHERFSMKSCLIVGFVSMLVSGIVMLTAALMEVESIMLTTVSMMFFTAGMVPTNSLLFPKALSLLPSNLQGCGQSLIQALRLLIASLGTGALGIFYTGPFLPVAVILMSILFVCLLCLFMIRGHLHMETDNAKGKLVIAAGH